MRVMLVCPYSLSTPGGVQGQVLGIAHALRGQGVDARILAPCDGPPPEPGIISVGPTVAVNFNGSVALVASGKVVGARALDAVRSYQPDVVHLHEPLVPGATHSILLGTDVPSVGTFHAASAEPFRLYRALRQPLKRALARLSIRTAVSEEAKRLAQDEFGGEFEVIPNGIDVARFAKADRYPSNERAILFVGRHEARKGLSVLLDAFATLDRNVELWVAGEGPETAELRSRGVRNVQWLGRVSDAELAQRFQGATVYCAPSIGGESFGIVLLEAMAASTPIVASSIPGYAAVARHEREALLVPPGDADALRVALQRVLDEPDLAAALVAAGEQRAAECSLDAVAERFVDIYGRAMARSAAHH